MNKTITIMVILISIIALPSYVLGEGSHKKIAGEYKSEIENNGFIVLYLNYDKSATIASIFWFDDDRKDLKTLEYNAEWDLSGKEITVTYNGIKQILSYHEELSLEEFNIRQNLPGLTTAKSNENHGLLDSVRLWRKDDLENLLSERNIKIYPVFEGVQSNPYFIVVLLIVVSMLSAGIGCKKPLIGGLAGALLFPLFSASFVDIEPIKMVLISLSGFLGGFFAAWAVSLTLSWVINWRSKSLDMGPSYIGGIGGGRGGGWPGGIVLSDKERRNMKK